MPVTFKMETHPETSEAYLHYQFTRNWTPEELMVQTKQAYQAILQITQLTPTRDYHVDVDGNIIPAEDLPRFDSILEFEQIHAVLNMQNILGLTRQLATNPVQPFIRHTYLIGLASNLIADFINTIIKTNTRITGVNVSLQIFPAVDDAIEHMQHVDPDTD